MRSKLILTSLVILLVTAGFSSTKAINADQDLPKFVLKQKKIISNGLVLKGVDPDTSRGFELIASRISNSRQVDRLWGSPTTSLNSTDLYVNGTINGNTIRASRTVSSFLQKAEYIPDLPVNERIQRANPQRTTNNFSFNIDRAFDVPSSYAELDANENFTKRTLPKYGVDAFIRSYFSVRMVDLNDSSLGVGQVYGFRLHLRIVIFDSDDRSFLAFQQNNDFAYGNMLPDFLTEYLKNLPIERAFVDAKGRLNDSRPGPLTKIEWLDLGYNSTYELNMYKGFYSFERNVISFALPRRIASVRINLNGQDFAGITDIEMALDELSLENELIGFEDENMENIDDAVLGVALQEDGLSLTDPFETSNPQATDSASITPTPDKTDASGLPYNISFFLIGIGVIVLMRSRKILKY